jgi:5-methylthioadenosine/S-adenosylhomocysteine deaminase
MPVAGTYGGCMDDGTVRPGSSTAVDPEIVRFVADAVVPCDGSVPVLRPGAVEVVGDTIVRVGRPGALRAGSAPAVREVRVDGALLPGMVNTHCHSPMTLFRGTGENLPLHRWLREVLWPCEAHLEAEDVY